MAESTLSLTYANIADEVCRYLGYSAYASCSTAEKARAVSTIKSGLRQFYTSHAWRFLQPEVNDVYTTHNRAITVACISYVESTKTLTAAVGAFLAAVAGDVIIMSGGTVAITATARTIATVAGNGETITLTTGLGANDSGAGLVCYIPVDDVPMVDAFLGMAGAVALQLDSERWHTLTPVGQGQMRDFRQYQGQTARKPTHYAVFSKVTTAGSGVRWHLHLWPKPDLNYRLMFAYHIAPDWDGTADSKYPLGGMQNAEVILASALAVAESREHDEIGVKANEYHRLLSQAISNDNLLMAPAVLGYNGDNSDGRSSRYLPLRGYRATLNFSGHDEIILT